MIVNINQGEAALERIPSTHPHLVLVDISLRGMRGLDMTRKLHNLYPEIRILIVTGHEIARYYNDAIKSGADDLVSKGIGKDIVSRCRRLLDI